MTAPARPLVIGCGVLERELRFIAAQKGWELDLELLGPMMHLDLPRLARDFGAQLERTSERDPRVFFGACHPRLDGWLAAQGRVRTRGVNCVEMLLGPERYEAELAGGAYFLLEAWVRDWREALQRTFGDRPALVREIFQGSHTHLLALRTPCSGDFEAEAEAASRQVGLPLQWATLDLARLEAVLAALLDRERAG